MVVELETLGCGYDRNQLMIEEVNARHLPHVGVKVAE